MVAFARRATYELLCACSLAAGVSAQVVAQLLLLQVYKAFDVSLGNFLAETIFAPFVLRLCSPEDWARCACCCREFRRWGMGRSNLTSFWLGAFSQQGRVEALCSAVEKNLLSLVRPVIEAKASVNCAFESCYSRTPLHRAAKRGNLALCEMLLSLRADVGLRDIQGAAPLHLVASKGRLQIVDILLEHGPESVAATDTYGRTPCHMAALKGHLAIVQRLLESRASIGAQTHDGRRPIDMARQAQAASVVEYLEPFEPVVEVVVLQAETDAEAEVVQM